MGDLEAKSISKQEDKDEIRRIFAYVYLVKQKVVYSRISTFFLIIGVIHHFIKYGNGHA